MNKLAFANYTDVPLTLIGLGLFIAVFVGSIVWVNLDANRQRYKQLAKNILEEGEQP